VIGLLGSLFVIFGVSGLLFGCAVMLYGMGSLDGWLIMQGLATVAVAGVIGAIGVAILE
jgi:hypothetical protein